MPDKPHIIIFNPDQWRGDVLGHMGDPAAVTPNLDRFAETEGVSFRNAFCQNPQCTPSRCSFMSGWYPHVRGHRSMGRCLHQPDDNNLLKTLKDHGYHVWWGGKNDLVPGQDGYEDYCDVKYSKSYHQIFDPEAEQPLSLYTADKQDEWRKPGTGYYSFMVGKIDKGDQPYYRDYDWACVEGAIKAIENAPADKPLCLFLAIAYPHPPYGVEEPWFSMIDRETVPDPYPRPEGWRGKCAFMKDYAEKLGMDGYTEEQWRELRAVYRGMCARVDHQFGLVMDALRKKDMYDDSAVFFFPDHGDFTGDYGLVEKHEVGYEDCLTRVPFLVKPPAGTPVKPRISEAMIELIDFPATVEELAGVSMPQPHFGTSLLPVLSGETDDHRDAVCSEGGRLESEPHVVNAASRGRTGSEEGMYWPKQACHAESLENCGKSVMLRTKTHKLVKRLYESDELYDLVDDPGELDNRIENPAYADVKDQLERRLLQLYLETSDIVPVGLDKRE